MYILEIVDKTLNTSCLLKITDATKRQLSTICIREGMLKTPFTEYIDDSCTVVLARTVDSIADAVITPKELHETKVTQSKVL